MLEQIYSFQKLKIVLTFFLELAFFIVAINWYSICYRRVRTFILSYIVYANIGKVQGVLKCQNNVIEWLFLKIVIVLSLNGLHTP